VKSQSLCLGRNHGVYGEVHVDSLAGRNTVFAISVGADENSPSKRYKGDPNNLNEDALFAYDDGQRCILAVADAHFGWQSSHLLITLISDQIPSAQVKNSADLGRIIEAFQSTDDSAVNSETTLLVSILDRKSGAGFGISFGDSSLVRVGPNADGQALNAHSRRYVTILKPHSLELRRGNQFQFNVESGDYLLAFTDGVDECNYRNSELSIQPDHLQSLHSEFNTDPRAYTEALMAMALKGVNGNPGGQDNIALIVCAV
jgi:hypothetical protein